MFVVLAVSERSRRGIFARVHNILTRPKIYLQPKEALGARFALLTVEADGGKVDWQAAEDICGRFSDRVLLPQGLLPPRESRIRSPVFPRFQCLMLLHTACALATASQIPMYRRVLGLIDPDGAHAGMLGVLLKHYTAVKVVTQNEALYRDEAERMMEEYGAPVMVGSTISTLEDCVLVLCPESFYTQEREGIRCPVLAGSTFVTGGPCHVINGLRTGSGGELARLCPADIDTHSFRAALFEFCGVEPEVYLAETMLHNCRNIGFEELLELMERLVGKISV